jgi:alpha-L-fucosidase
MRSLVVVISLALALTLRLAAQSPSGAVERNSQPASPTAPTINQDAATLDRIWQQAVSKYDAPRAAMLKEVDRVGAAGPFRPDWSILDKYQTPQWYKDAKFGIFIHWGVFSVPAFGDEWYPRRSYSMDSREYKHHVATYGTHDKFGYKDLIPMFKAEHYDPNAWAQLFKESGAKYVIPVFEHHDGFAMYDSSLSDWTVVKMGPHRDLYAELSRSLHAQHLYMGASFHRAEHNWFFSPGREFTSDVNDPKFASLYGPAHPRIAAPEADHELIEDWTFVSPAYTADWLARASEIVQKYHPDIVWFDWWVGEPAFRNDLARFSAYYYNESSSRGTVGVINYKDHSMKTASAILDVERGQLSDIRPYTWQTDTSISNVSWGYIEGDTYKQPQVLVQQLVDIVSKNGNLLLNIGPRADGSIPDAAQQVLLGIGSWLKINGDAIYGTHPWKIYGEGPTKVAAGAFHDTDTQAYTPQDFRFTVHGETLYAIELAWPSNNEAVVRSFASDAPGGQLKVAKVTLLGNEGTVQFEQQPDGLHLHLPAAPKGKYAFAYRIDLQGGSVASGSQPHLDEPELAAPASLVQ